MDNSTKMRIVDLQQLVDSARQGVKNLAAKHHDQDAMHVGTAIYLLAQIIGTAVIAAMDEDDELDSEPPNDID
jgi:hypothetical protein